MTNFVLYPPIAAIVLLWASGASAAPAQAAPHWAISPTKSRLTFSGTQTGTRFDGTFRRWNASINFDPAHPETSQIVVLVDLASASTNDPQRDTALPGPEWLDVGHFRQARYATSAVRRIGTNSYEATGVLALRGVSGRVVLPFTVQITGNVAHATGHITLMRTAYGVGQGTWASGKWVALEVGVNFDIVASR